MLNDSKVEANIPASDLARARDFYADKLGLTPTEEFGGEVLVYRTAGGTAFNIYRTDYAGQAGHTIAQWHVDRHRVGGPRPQGEGHHLRGLRPARASRGTARSPPCEGMGRAAWFKDSEGNTMCIDQADTGR